ncbi:hypothetical protein D3C87_1525560 [compost metagenome]
MGQCLGAVFRKLYSAVAFQQRRVEKIGEQLEITQMATPVGRPFVGRNISLDCQESQPPSGGRERQGDAVETKAELCRCGKKRLAIGMKFAGRRPIHRPDATQGHAQDRIDALIALVNIGCETACAESVVQPVDNKTRGQDVDVEIKQICDTESAAHQVEKPFWFNDFLVFHNVQQVKECLLVSHAAKPCYLMGAA